MTIAPLWQALTVSGTYSTTNGSSTISLTKQEDDRTWKNAASAYLLPPSSQPASVSVNITIGSMTKTYTYSCYDQLEAVYKINIDGTYTEAVGVNLTGTITGQHGWGKGLSASSSTITAAVRLMMAMAVIMGITTLQATQKTSPL